MHDFYYSDYSFVGLGILILGLLEIVAHSDDAYRRYEYEYPGDY